MHEYLTIFLEQFSGNPVAQILGLFAFFVSVYNFVFCSGKKFVIVTAIASFFWSMHFFALSSTASEALFGGILSAAIINLFDIGKNLLGLKYEKNIKIVIAISLFYLAVGMWTFMFVKPELVGFFPTLTAILSTYLVFYVRSIWLNLGFLGITGLWLVFNFVSGSLGGMMTDIFLLIFGLTGITRMLVGEKLKKARLDV